MSNDWAQRVHDALLGDRNLVPPHALRRLGTLVQEAPIAYAEARIDVDSATGSKHLRDGSVVILTDKLVIQAALEKSPERSLGDESTVTITLLPRKDLIAVSMLDSSPDYDWSHSETVWTSATQLKLTYARGDELRLPLTPELGASQKAIVSLLAELWADLAA